ncbi:FAD:protein FMN transferase [Sulfitobacter mediterraneus]|jgi:FAD:protein FMN transferase|uniref:FAD:protein FMN transferase n=1 Tax=Sulfitobacter mediterraneus TaxID=83219 RepID=UPI000EA2BFE0|nr:FAD:protein FMN transferase [Sulfitobacter mediterraneus]UWR10248.1 FAD:protein FMN transferase [Sulfitobacter mediterraneus]
MTVSRRRFIAITAGFALASGQASAAQATADWQGVALGARVQLRLVGLDQDHAAHLIDITRNELLRLEKLFSLYQPGSALSQLNAEGRLQAPPPEMLELLGQAGAIHRATDGLFDPTIQPLWTAYANANGTPTPDTIVAAHAKIGWEKVRFGAGEISFDQEGMQLTLNGIAQGYITDRITALLRSNGVTDAVVDMGEVSAMGQGPDQEPWRIGLAEKSDQPAAQSIRLSNKSVATSAPQGMTIAGQASHILDPRTGNPAPQYWSRVSVIHPSAAIADGLSTAASLMQADQMRSCIKGFACVDIIAAGPEGRQLRLRVT